MSSSIHADLLLTFFFSQKHIVSFSFDPYNIFQMFLMCFLHLNLPHLPWQDNPVLQASGAQKPLPQCPYMLPTLWRSSLFLENAMLSYVQNRTFVQAEYIFSCRPQLMETSSEFMPSDGLNISCQKFASISIRIEHTNNAQDTYLCIQIIMLDKPINCTELAPFPHRIAKHAHPHCSSFLLSALTCSQQLK